MIIKDFFGDYVELDKYDSTMIWGVHKHKADGVKDGLQRVADIRGWGAIQNMFKKQEDAENFQDRISQFIVDAINEKITKET